MAKRHYLPITADVPGVNDSQRAFIRKVIRTALAAEGVDFPCEVDVLHGDHHVSQRHQPGAGVGVLRAGQLAANGLVEALRG